ncbi:phosphorylase [Shewanella sp. 0m-4]
MLWTIAEKLTKSGVQTGALLPLTDADTLIELDGINYVGNIVTENMAKKHQPQVSLHDPFLAPYDPALYIGEIGSEHVCLLNKFPIITPHILICAKECLSQTSALRLVDFKAWIQGFSSADTLGFFNAGHDAGASQMHRHMQIVKTPITLEALILSGKLPFKHYLFQFEHLDAQLLIQHYNAAMLKFGRYKATLTDGAADCLPYNILLTQGWMLIVPRSTNVVGTVSGHGLCYSGRFLVNSEQQLCWLTEYGFLQFLTECGYPIEQ